MHNILVTASNGQLGNKLRLVVEENDIFNRYFFTDLPELDIIDKAAVSAFVKSNKIDIVFEFFNKLYP